jgi:hypothetical protein
VIYALWQAENALLLHLWHHVTAKEAEQLHLYRSKRHCIEGEDVPRKLVIDGHMGLIDKDETSPCEVATPYLMA